jgi:phosphopantetheinyl transferase
MTGESYTLFSLPMRGCVIHVIGLFLTRNVFWLAAVSLDCYWHLSAFAVSAARAPIFTSQHGKQFSPGGPQFNVSHSGNLFLIALHPKLPVGVDVEIEAAPIPAWKAIAGRILQPK